MSHPAIKYRVAGGGGRERVRVSRPVQGPGCPERSTVPSRLVSSSTSICLHPRIHHYIVHLVHVFEHYYDTVDDTNVTR